MNMEKRCAIYVRVSTHQQDYTRQLSELKDIAIKDGFTESNIEIFSENISGTKRNDDRPELSLLLKKVEETPELFSCVYVSEISRLGRNPTQTRQTIDKLTDLGVPVYIQNINEYSIKNGKRNGLLNIILQVLIEYAASELETIKTRFKSGMLQKAKDGKAVGGVMQPYGYTKDNKGFLVIEPTEAETIKQVFNLYSKGNGIKIIAGILNENNIPTRTNKTHTNKIVNKKSEKQGNKVKWSDKQVLDILSNTIYKGQRRYKEIIIEAPIIIEPNLFDQCTKIRESKTHRNYLTTYTYLLKDLCICGKCGRNYFAKYKPTPTGDKVYMCSSRLVKGGNCGNCGVNISLIESVLFDMLLSSDMVLKYLNNTQEITTQLKVEIQQLEMNFKISNSNLTIKKDEFERLLDLYVSGALKKERYLERNSNLENEIENLNQKIVQIQLELEKKKDSLNQFSTVKATKKMLMDSINDRTQLQTIFKQIFHKVIINKVDENNVMLNVYLSINGVILLQTIKVLLDVTGVKKKTPIYKYKTLAIMNIEPRYNANNTIQTDVKDHLQEFNQSFDNWISIDNNSVLNIPKKPVN